MRRRRRNPPGLVAPLVAGVVLWFVLAQKPPTAPRRRRLLPMRPDGATPRNGATTPAPAPRPTGPEIPYEEGMGVRAAGTAFGGGLGAGGSGVVDRDAIAERLVNKPDDPEVIAEALAALGLYSGRTSGFTAATAPPQLTAAYQRVWRDIGSPQGADADDRIISAILRRLQPGALTATRPLEGWTRY